jgi:hypothetical protein
MKKESNHIDRVKILNAGDELFDPRSVDLSNVTGLESSLDECYEQSLSVRSQPLGRAISISARMNVYFDLMALIHFAETYFICA